MNKGVSVIVCCYNSVSRIKQTLEYLSKQIVAPHIPWEVIVVDNNSSDGTAKYAKEVWQELDCNVPFFTTFEPQAGLSFARKKGISSAQYEYLLFCDDDNWLNEDYIQIIFDIFQREINVSAIGGVGEPICEVVPPKWFNKLEGSYYACGALYNYNGIIKEKTGVVYGAGMGIKKSIFEKLVKSGFRFTLTGRKGNKQLMGEEMEMGLMFKILGYDIWYDNRLRFKHFITKKRFEWSYFQSLRNNFGKAMYLLLPYYNILAFGDISLKQSKALRLKKLFLSFPYQILRLCSNDFKVRQEALGSIIMIWCVFKSSSKQHYLACKNIIKIKDNFLKKIND